MNQFLTTISVMLNATLMYAPPLLFAAMGSCFSEKSGVVNIGIDGMMTVGAFVGAAVGYFTGNPWIAFLAAGLAGGALALVHAFAAISCQANQTISGTAINFLASGISVFACRLLFQGDTETMPVPNKMPLIFNKLFQHLATTYPDGIGKYFSSNSLLDNIFNTYASTYLAFIAVLIVWYIFYKTRFGLRLQAVGEHPEAANTLGINVVRIRYVCVVLSGVLAGFGGAAMTLATVSSFRPSIVVGQGFIAMAAVIFGGIRPQGALIGCLIFAFCSGLRVIVGSSTLIPVNLISMIPYVATVICLIFFVGRVHLPSASGQPFKKVQ
ncbi:MAG: ABC transporter permease [Erysipelotrichaceae bacterium]|nr:ABC transporter permease [Erysipelotrichaceae bacterium]